MTAQSLLLIERALWLAGIFCSLALVARFFQLKLTGSYHFFLAYLLFDSIRSIAGWFFSPGSTFYKNLWTFTEPVIWVLYVLVVLELSSLTFKEYRGIQALGRWTVYGSLIVSVFLSTITVLPTWIHSGEPAISLQRFLMVERGIDSALVLLLLLLLAFLVVFPIQLSKNVMTHAVLYSVFFLSNSLGILIVNLAGRQLSNVMSTCLMGATDLCLIAWLTLIRREGEQKMIVIRNQMPAVDESRLIEHLESINATLLRASKKASPVASSVRR